MTSRIPSSPESPAKEQPGEVASHFHTLALKMIAEWDCLNPPRHDLLSDLPWLKRLIDRALAGHDPRVETAPQPDAHKGTSEIEVEPAVAAPDVAAMVKRLREGATVLDETFHHQAIADTMEDAAALLEKLGQGWIPVSSGRRPEHYPFVVRWNDETATNTCDRYEAIDHQGLDWSYATHWTYLPPPPERP